MNHHHHHQRNLSQSNRFKCQSSVDDPPKTKQSDVMIIMLELNIESLSSSFSLSLLLLLFVILSVYALFFCLFIREKLTRKTISDTIIININILYVCDFNKEKKLTRVYLLKNEKQTHLHSNRIVVSLSFLSISDICGKKIFYGWLELTSTN